MGAHTMEADQETRVPADELTATVAGIFRICGMAGPDAALLADSLVAADLGGVHSHGVLRVPEYVKKLTAGGVNPRGRPAIARDSGACLVVDGGNSMGQIGASYAMDRAIERARSTGIAAVAVRGSNHCGAMAYYVQRAAQEKMIGIATTNALPTMAPWGGTERLLGINPLGVAIPAAEEPPIVYDAAFSGSAHGKIRVYQQKDWMLPEGWAMDRAGNPTTDPAAAIDGLLTPIGGFKGTGLAMIMGMLSSMLSGAAYGTELGDMERGPTAGMDGHFLATIRIDAFEDVDRFTARVDAAIRQVHAAKRALGVDRLYVPGEKEYITRQTYARDGIPLNTIILSDIRETADALGIATAVIPWLASGQGDV
jgi:LDH2 family malate/lactate/ureidoglycolate dehydrogenase